MRKFVLPISLTLCSLFAIVTYLSYRIAPDKISTESPREEPKGFDEFEHLIRTRDGESAPSYAPNYKMDEFQRALTLSKRMKSVHAKLDWQERGPGNIAGRTRGIIIDVSDATGQTWFAGTAGGGIWKTTNKGSSWINLTDNLPNLAAVSLAQSQSKPDVMYAGTGEGYSNIDAVRGDGIFKSVDHGNTWKQLTATAGNTDFSYVNRLVVDPADDNTIVAATNIGLFKSADGGVTWKSVYKGTGRIQQVIANPKKFNVLYATERAKGVLKSTNKGETWTNVTPTTLISGFLRMEMAIAPSDTSRLYVSADSSGAASVVGVSRNSGADWNKLAENTKPAYLGDQGWYDNTIAVHPTNPNLVFIGGVNVWRIDVNDNNTKKSAVLSSSNYHADQHNIMFHPTGNNQFAMITANDGGMAYSAGDPWTGWTQFTNYQTTQFYGAAKKPGSSTYVGGMQDNGTAYSELNPKAEDRWSKPLGGDGFEVIWHASDPNKLMGGSQYNTFSRSINGGASWSASTTGLANVGSTKGAPFINRLSSSVLNPDVVFAVGDQGVWRTDDFGANWTVKKPDNGWKYGGSSTQVEASNVNANLVWSGSAMSKTGGIVYSLDNGETWKAANGYPDVTMGSITSLYAHPTRDSTAFLTFSFSGAPHILRTDDLGKTWKDITGFGTNKTSDNGFPNVATYSVAVMPNNPNTIWAGTEIGLFESTDNGKSWHYSDNGLPAVSIWELRIFEDEVIVATHGRGIWSVTMPELLNGQFLPPFSVSIKEKFLETPQLNFTLRSVCDSTVLFSDGKRVSKMAANTPNQVVNIPLSGVKQNLDLKIYKNSKISSTPLVYTPTLAFQAPQAGVATDFDTGTNPFMSPCGNKSGIDGWDGYYATTVYDGFTGKALHSPHPYNLGANASFTCTLAIPIIVDADPAKAYISFDEVAIIEPGSGSTFGQIDFGGYVIVEGSKDGITWTALANGYNAKANSEWLSLYQAKQAPKNANLKKRTFNLHNKFSAGDKIALRFRIVSGVNATNAWGWVIDNLEVQRKIATPNEDDSQPLGFTLQQNYPNPFNPSTKISYTLPKASMVQLQVYNIAGQRVASLVNEQQSSGTHTLQFNAAHLSSGVYFYRLQAGSFVETKKMLLMK
jgi:hypothetical protein